MGMFYDMESLKHYSAIHEKDEEDEDYTINPDEENDDTAANTPLPNQNNNEEDEDYTINPDEEDNTEYEPGDDNQNQDEEDEDYTINPDEEDNTGDENEENNDGAQTQNNDEEDEDYTINPDEEDDTGDDETQNNDTEADIATTGSTAQDDKLKQIESELFETLSDQEKNIKIAELKNCYAELSERCDSILELINKTEAPDEVSRKVFDYVINTITDLQQYIYDYFTSTFTTKSYMENVAQYHKYLAILNSIRTVLAEVQVNSEE